MHAPGRWSCAAPFAWARLASRAATRSWPDLGAVFLGRGAGDDFLAVGFLMNQLPALSRDNHRDSASDRNPPSVNRRDSEPSSFPGCQFSPELHGREPNCRTISSLKCMVSRTIPSSNGRSAARFSFPHSTTLAMATRSVCCHDCQQQLKRLGAFGLGNNMIRLIKKQRIDLRQFHEVLNLDRLASFGARRLPVRPA